MDLLGRLFDPAPGPPSTVYLALVAVFLLGWEMLYLFKILPIRLSGH